jgi:hypothetical protein
VKELRARSRAGKERLARISERALREWQGTMDGGRTDFWHGGAARSTKVLSKRAFEGPSTCTLLRFHDRRLELRRARPFQRLLWDRCQSGGLLLFRWEVLAQQHYFQAKIDCRCPRSRVRTTALLYLLHHSILLQNRRWRMTNS